MNDSQQTANPIHRVIAALACARKIRARASERTAAELDDKTSSHLDGIASTLAGPEAFSEEALDRLRGAITILERQIATGTTVGFETCDAWDDRGIETTAVRSAQQMTKEALLLAISIVDGPSATRRADRGDPRPRAGGSDRRGAASRLGRRPRPAAGSRQP
jgi:hypothetical protein